MCLLMCDGVVETTSGWGRGGGGREGAGSVRPPPPLFAVPWGMVSGQVRGRGLYRGRAATAWYT